MYYAINLQVTVMKPPVCCFFHHADSYPPSQKASPPYGRYQIILLGGSGSPGSMKNLPRIM